MLRATSFEPFRPLSFHLQLLNLLLSVRLELAVLRPKTVEPLVQLILCVLEFGDQARPL